MFLSEFPKVPASPAVITTMKDVKDHIEAVGPAYLLQSIRTLQTHLRYGDLADVPASIEWFDENFPLARGGIHPRPDLPQKIAAYKKWCADIRRCVDIATGRRAQRETLRQLDDEWKALIDGFQLHCRDNGLVHRAALAPIVKLSDVCRAAGIQPFDLAADADPERLEAAITIAPDRRVIRTALQLMQRFHFIPEIGAHLSPNGVLQLPSKRDLKRLPDRIETYITQLAERAASSEDKVARRDTRKVSESTVGRYLSALRYHFRTLVQCSDNDAADYGYEPIRDLKNVEDPSVCLSFDHLAATLRQSERADGTKGSVRRESVACYLSDIMVVLWRNNLITGEEIEDLKSFRYLAQGRERNNMMTPETRAWCERLLADPLMERRFRNLHRLAMAKANEILAAVAAQDRPMTDRELSKVRNLGVVAAACAIEYAGRPIRMANVLGLRINGDRANFFMPGREHKTYRFELHADQTKAAKDEAMTELSIQLHGKAVMDWYVKTIRPLFPASARSPFLFPSVMDPAKPMPRTAFDAHFQRIASEVGIPMTFHKWRHGFASLLLRENWSNLTLAADMLGNTPNVCSRNYVFINKSKLIKEGQKVILESARRLG